jgi:ATP-binding cassette, subfamily F, member 3
VCDEFWLVSRGGVAPFDGDLDDYQRYLLRRSQAPARRSQKSQQCTGPQSRGSRQNTGAQNRSEALEKKSSTKWMRK